MGNNTINISKKDVAWNYLATFFSLATGIIVLPFILHKLSPEEIGMNYLMQTVSSIVMLIDFGFRPQFGRNFTYVLSGVQSLKAEGVEQNHSGIINYHLLAVLLKTARRVYSLMSIAGLTLMLTGGTLYIYYVTNGFSTVEHSLYIWLIFSFSVYFNIYFSYYPTLLTGSGMIAESSKATVFTRIVQVALNISLLYLGWGLFSVVVANCISPFVLRIYCYKTYFTKELKAKINVITHKDELSETFKAIWHNAVKLGINNLGNYAINKLGMFLVGLYLPLAVVGSYGLLIQLSTIVSGVAVIMSHSYMPKFAYYRVTGQIKELTSLFSFTVIVYWMIMIVGGLVIVFGGQAILSLIKSNTQLPAQSLCAIYILILALEGNHSNFATLITTKNEVPFVAAGLISGGVIAFFTFLSLRFTGMGLLGVVLCQGVVQLCYNNWYWPHWVLKDLNVSLYQFFCEGLTYTRNLVHKLLIKI